MSRAIIRRAGATVIVAGVLLQASAAVAYERRERGDLSFIVGWGEPPAFAGERNSVQLVLVGPGGPVVSGVDLEVTLGRGDEELRLPLLPHFEPDVWGQPGDYRAFFVPTQPGAYTFRLSGTVDGKRFRERFSTGTGIEDVVDPGSVSLPAAPDASPSPGTDLERLEASVGRLEASVGRLEAATRRALADATDARGLAVAGLVYGLLALLGGLAVAWLAFLRRRGVSRRTSSGGR